MTSRWAAFKGPPFGCAAVSRTALLHVLMIALLFFMSAGVAHAQKRVALVIGNADYRHEAALANPVKDARDIAAILSKAGFNLVGGRALTNLTKAEMERALLMFGTAARGADFALIFYSGHGLQIGGANYLAPTDAAAVSESDVGLKTVKLDLFMRQLEASQARLKIVFLDACRNNPFVQARAVSGHGTREMGTPRGLARMDADDDGTVIAFATQPGNVASDGPAGENSPYTAALRDHMVRPGLGLFELLNDVGTDVRRATKRAQVPWFSASPIPRPSHITPPVAIVAPTQTPASVAGLTITQPREVPDPTPPPAVVSTGASVPLIQQASAALDARNYTLAEDILGRAAKLDPVSALPHSFLGYTAFMQGDEQAAGARRLANLQARRTAVIEALQYYGRAFPSFDRAILLDPQYAPVRRHRGNAVIAVYKARQLAGLDVPRDIIDRAIVDIRAAVDLDPTSKTSANSLGEAYLLKPDPIQALRWFDRAIEINPTYAAPYAGRCTAYVQLGNMKAAMENAKAAAARDSDQKQMQCLGPMAKAR